MRKVKLGFWSYLWGFETRSRGAAVAARSRRFWSYLWGFETSFRQSWIPPSHAFWSYLWGFETAMNRAARLEENFRFGVTYEGLKLAMSYWRPSAPHQGFGVTYEGLKRVPPGSCRGSRRRFGVTYEGLKHNTKKPQLTHLLEFWSYLWGFETHWWRRYRAMCGSFGVTYEGLKLSTTTDWKVPVVRFWSYLWGFETR